VVYNRPGATRPTSAVPTDEQALAELFDQIEQALDQRLALAAWWIARARRCAAT
jgi:hypothetical protein